MGLGFKTCLSNRRCLPNQNNHDYSKLQVKECVCPNRKETIPNRINPVTNEPTTTDFEKAECLNKFWLGKPRLM